jgi:hypothetical protein
MYNALKNLYNRWDIRMDWGLMDKHAGGNKFLREEIVYPSR